MTTQHERGGAPSKGLVGTVVGLVAAGVAVVAYRQRSLARNTDEFYRRYGPGTSADR